MDREPGSRALKLRADACFVAEADGVRLWNSHGSYFVKGKSAYVLIRSLFRSFDGTRTVDQMCAGLDEARRRAVERQISKLAERGFVKEVALPRAPVPPWAAQSYGDVLEFLDQFEGEPFARLMAFRRRRITCIGSGALLRNLAAMLLEHGAGRIVVVELRPTGAISAVDDILAAVRLQEPAMDLGISASAWPFVGEEPPGAEAETIIAASDALPPEEFVRLARLARERGATFSAVSPAGDLILAVPLVTDESSICWECAYRAVFVEAKPGEARAVSPLAAALGCHQVVHALFGHITGIRPVALDQVATVDPVLATSRLRRIWRHPACGAHEAAALPVWSDDTSTPLRPELPMSTDPDAVTEAQNAIAAHTERLTDAIVGPLLHVGEDDVPQLPLSGSRCLVRSLRSSPERSAVHELICRGPSARETRNQIVLLAFERLGWEATGSAPAFSRLRHDHLLSGFAIGAGWSPDEARFRAVYHWTVGWAQRAAATAPPVERSWQPASDDAIAAWLVNVLSDGGPEMPAVAIAKAPNGLLVAHAVGASGACGFGAGLDSKQAARNALADLACKTEVGWPSASGQIRPALLPAGVATWRDLLIVAHGSTRLRWWDACDLLPFCSGIAWLALLHCEEEA